MEHPKSTAKLAGQPIHSMLASIPIGCFIGAFVTDLTYWRTAEMMWANFSAWLITVGIIVGVLAALVGLIDFLWSRRIRQQPIAWLHVIGNLVALILAFFNMLVHTRDAWTSVVPTGLTLSSLVVIIVTATGWLGRALVYRHHVGVADETAS